VNSLIRTWLDSPEISNQMVTAAPLQLQPFGNIQAESTPSARSLSAGEE
jgi:hypothetical protein